MANHKTFSSLSIALGNIASDVVKNAEKTIQQASIAGYTALIFATPVDTGRARASWIVSFGAPIPNDVGATSESNVTPFINRAINTIKGYQLTKGSLYISNGVPYIDELEKGHSAQARTGMLRFGVKAAESVLKNAKLLG